MSRRVSIDVPINRVEGDLEVSADLVDGGVVDARASGTMYRGFEKILQGRGALDGLVLTPRVCGICSTSHLAAAAAALDAIAGAAVPPEARRVRNVLLLVEHLQSDVRHAFLTFTADFANPAWTGRPLHEEAVRRYEPFRGETVLEAVRETRGLLEVVATLAGQWPHSSSMVPGGVVSLPASADLVRCRLLLSRFREWYERRVLGCALERFAAVASGADLDAWLDEAPSHQQSEVGFFLRFARGIGLHRTGRGCGTFLSFGSPELPEEGSAKGPDGGNRLVPAGLSRRGEVFPLDEAKVGEDVSHSWAASYSGRRHPFEGETQPYASGHEGERYSWAKAPRYDGDPAETGPLAEAAVARDPLFGSLLASEGPSTFLRELARLTRPVRMIPAIQALLAETNAGGRFYVPPGELESGRGAGLVSAARGALGHWVTLKDGRIERYQIVTPTSWNASPRDESGVRGPMEEALVGTPVADPENPVELGHVVRSFDACLVCTVHALRLGRRAGSLRLGA